MAKVLTNFPARIRTEQYPWSDWFDGLPRLLEEGVDYQVASTSFRASAHQAAKRYGIKVRMTMQDGGLAIQSYRPTNG
jgi:hypothetical protein|tara:strand:- start:1068 stop:1301 length:234 start_codon:yes stop_codon:yes gene_type:complete